MYQFFLYFCGTMNRFRLLYKYLVHFFSARNTRGYGVHSPFIFHFTKFILNDRSTYYSFQKIESLRGEMKMDKRIINVQDFGTGFDRQRKVSDIANKSLKSEKYGQLLFRIVNYFKSKNILELGTSLGITTLYLASSSTNTKCVSMEGCAQIARIASENFNKLNLKNIEILVGNIDDSLPQFLNDCEKLDLIFFDANHRSEAVLNYFELCLGKVDDNSIVIFDDIYWSADMEKAWKIIKNHPKVKSTIDLFQIGIVFFNQDLNKKHYKMRY